MPQSSEVTVEADVPETASNEVDASETTQADDTEVTSIEDKTEAKPADSETVL